MPIELILERNFTILR